MYVCMYVCVCVCVFVCVCMCVRENVEEKELQDHPPQRNFSAVTLSGVFQSHVLNSFRSSYFSLEQVTC